MSSIDEKRVHGTNTDAAALFVACDIGLVRVAVAGERVGKIELTERRTARDLAIANGRMAVATDEDVLAGESPEATGFGPATAVGFADELLAASPTGTVARREGDGWTEVGTVECVRAIDGNLLGTEGGIYRLTDGELHYSGLDDVRDVVTAGTPHAATATGLYRLGNGWMNALDGDFEMVSTDAAGRAYAATTEQFYTNDGEWTPIDEIDRAVVGIADAGGVYAVTRDGTLLIETNDGWREHPLGAGEARAVVARTDRNPV
jgi:hypothetical protein